MLYKRIFTVLLYSHIKKKKTRNYFFGLDKKPFNGSYILDCRQCKCWVSVLDSPTLPAPITMPRASMYICYVTP